MKSKRVAKLLACALTVAMSASTPVFASGGLAPSGTIKTEFGGIKSPTITMTLDTTADVWVNPLYDPTNGTGVNKFRFASKNISANNRSVDDQGVSFNVMLTATAKVKNKGTGVKVYYDAGASSASKFVGSDSSSAKECYLEMQQGTGTSTNQATYQSVPASTGKSAVVTTQGSRLQFKVPAATATQGAGYAEFAVIGDANTGAKWESGDLSLEMTYSLAPATANASVTGTDAPSITAWAATSGNALSINNFVTDAQLAGAKVTKFTVFDPKMDSAEVDMAQDAFKWTRNSADTGYDLEVPKTDAILTWLGKEQKGKAYGLLITFDDGRVSKTTVTVN